MVFFKTSQARGSGAEVLMQAVLGAGSTATQRRPRARSPGPILDLTDKAPGFPGATDMLWIMPPSPRMAPEGTVLREDEGNLPGLPSGILYRMQAHLSEFFSRKTTLKSTCPHQERQWGTGTYKGLWSWAEQATMCLEQGVLLSRRWQVKGHRGKLGVESVRTWPQTLPNAHTWDVSSLCKDKCSSMDVSLSQRGPPQCQVTASTGPQYVLRLQHQLQQMTLCRESACTWPWGPHALASSKCSPESEDRAQPTQALSLPSLHLGKLSSKETPLPMLCVY